MKLTKAAIDKRPCPMTGDDWEWDSELPGFGVKFAASGRKTYVLRYRTRAGKARKQTIGLCAAVPPERARAVARDILAEVAEGKDPMEKPAAQPTMTELSERYMAEYALAHKKERSIIEDDRAWKNRILPTLGKRKVADITKADVMKLHASMKATPNAANYVVAVLSKAFNLAEEWELRPQNTNPCHLFKKFPVKAKKLFFTQAQAAAVDHACAELVAEGGQMGITPAMAALTRLWLITGCRNNELRMARPRFVDFEARALRLPDSKVGERIIPLPQVAIDILKTLPRDGEWLFPGQGYGQPIKNPWRAWKRIAKRAGVPLESTPHTLRHTNGSLGHHAGLSQKQIAEQLGHGQLSTTELYLHGVADEQAAAAERIAEAVTAGWGK
jgi:integrase